MFASLELKLCPKLVEYFPEMEELDLSTEKLWGIEFTKEDYVEFRKSIKLDDIIHMSLFDIDEVKDRITTGIITISNDFFNRE